MYICNLLHKYFTSKPMHIYEVKTKRKVEVDVNQNVNYEDQDVFVKQKIKIYIDKPKDEKLSRNAHNRAGAGSTFPCTYCTLTRAEASDPPFSGISH